MIAVAGLDMAPRPPRLPARVLAASVAIHAAVLLTPMAIGLRPEIAQEVRTLSVRLVTPKPTEPPEPPVAVAAVTPPRPATSDPRPRAVAAPRPAPSPAVAPPPRPEAPAVVAAPVAAVAPLAPPQTSPPEPMREALAPPPPPPAPAMVAARFDADYLHNPKPPYPPLSRRLQEQGRVVLTVNVTPQGAAAQVDLRQSSGFARLDESALETVRNWRFVPARRGDEPVSAQVVVPIVFRLDG